MNVRSLLLTLSVALFVASTAGVAFADSGVYGTYGAYGGYGSTPTSTSGLVVDKQVGKPGVTKGGTFEYVDNLSSADPRFAPGSEVSFRIRAKNVTGVDMEGVTIQDSLPDFVEPISGPGTYNKDNRTVSYNVGTLKAGAEVTLEIRVKVADQNTLPADRGLFCLTNRATATANNQSNSQDTAQFCVEKQVGEVKGFPKSGPELGIVLLAGQAGLLGLGALTLKRAKRS